MKEAYSFRLLLLVIVSLSFFPAYSQVKRDGNINSRNGLPSNHIYSIVTDKFGYLWIATEKGVVRYNGYEFKLFDVSDGLPTSNIWGLFEDRKNRMWLCSLSEELGYIHCNRYYKAGISNNSGRLYPGIISDANGHAVLTTVSGDQIAIGIENNDTFRFNIVDNSMLNKRPVRFTFGYCINALGKYTPSVIALDSTLYRIEVDGKNAHLDKLSSLSESISEDLRRNIGIVFNSKLIIQHTQPSSDFIVVDLLNGKTEHKNLKQYGIAGSILYIYTNAVKTAFYIITDNDILQFTYGNNITFEKSYKINDIIPDKSINGNHIRPVYIDTLWGRCLGSTNKGLWRNYDVENKFIPVPETNLGNYKFLGNVNDSTFFWWNSTKNIMAWSTTNLNMNYKLFTNVPVSIYSIAGYNGDTALITGVYSYFFVGKTHKLIPTKLYNAFMSVIEKPGTIYTINRYGFCKGNYTHDSGFSLHILSKDRYNGLLFDSLRKNYWAYNSDNIFMYSAEKSTDTLISKEKLSALDVKKIEKIVIDNKYGNIFIKGSDKIILYNTEKNSYSELFTNYNQKDASIYVHNNIFIVTGKFGILFCKILGPQRLSHPLLYSNLANTSYSSIYECEVSSEYILLTTDEGAYKVAIPSEQEILQSKEGKMPYKFILYYKDTALSIRTGDTIAINQKDLRLQFDVINPVGTGHLKYRYNLFGNAEWKELNTNELTLPFLPPGGYYPLSVIVNDGAWRSDEIKIYFYIQPYWWQAGIGLKLLWLGLVMGVVLLFAIAVSITKKIVLKTAQRKNMQMELELKAIYAQINPHFIFNTLNSALLLVRKKKFDEAYTHIYQFSRLLRSYIKSSRNKLITIADEVTNLKDYLELQRTRYSNKFGYSIEADESIAPGRVSIPSLLLQPFVENALNHGLLRKKDAGLLTIKFTSGIDENEIICTIDDNGIGRKQAQLEKDGLQEKETSYGDLLIKDLVSIFNKYEQMNIEIKYFDKELPLTGTTVVILIRNPHYD